MTVAAARKRVRADRELVAETGAAQGHERAVAGRERVESAGLGGLLERPKRDIARVEQCEQLVGERGALGSAARPVRRRRTRDSTKAVSASATCVCSARPGGSSASESSVSRLPRSDKRERPARGRDRLGAGGKRRFLLGGQVPEAYERGRVVLDAAGEDGCGPRQLVVVATPAGALLQVRFEQVGRAGPWPGR